MSRVNSKEKYIVSIFELFKTTGLNVTMEEIASGINLTKKTLYNNFLSKDELLREVMDFFLQKVSNNINSALKKGRDAIEALYLTSNMMNDALQEMGPKILNDISQLLPTMTQLDHTNRMSYYSSIVRENIERGRLENLYKEDFNIDLVTLFFTSAMSKIYAWDGGYIYLNDPYKFHSELIKYHLEAIVNDNGRKKLKKYLNKS